MKQLFILSILTCMSSFLKAQSVPMAFEDWKTTAGTQNFFYKNVTKTDASNNVYVAGATLNSAGNTDILLAKYSPNGIQLWIRQYAGAGNGTDFAAGLVVTSTDVYVTGAVTTSTASPTTDAITMRYTSAGVFQWATTYNGTGNLHDAGKHVVLDASNNIYITGASYNASGNSDFLTIKYSPTGVQQWVSTYNYASNLDDAAIKIVASGANVTVTGAVTSSPSNYKFATVKYTQATGAITNTDVSVAVTTASVDVVADLATDGAGNVYVVGSTFVTGQGTNYYVQKLSTTLVTAWTYTFNGASSLNDVAKGVQVDATGNVYITGYSTSSTQGRNIATIKLNSSGVQQWVQYYNDTSNKDDEASDLVLDASANVYITGYNTNTLNKTDYYTIKYKSNGTKQWDVITDGGAALNDNATNITLDSLNNVIITGQSETTSSTFNFLTVKYAQYDVTNPVDLMGQPTNRNFGYHQNRGQIRNDTGGISSSVLFYTHNQYPNIYIEKNAYNYVSKKTDTLVAIKDTIERIQVAFSNASTTTKPYGYSPKTYPLHYFLGHTNGPIIDVKGQDRLITKNIYTNIDLHYYSNSKGFKYYFVVNPGGNPSSISLNISGAITTSIISNNLFIDGKLADITLKQPYAYMVNGLGVTTTLSVVNWTNTAGVYKITTPTYTNTQTLIYVVETISAAPAAGSVANLEYSTFYGRTNNDIFNDIRVAPSGDRYVVGNTDGAAFPSTPGTFPYSAGRDAVLLKYSVIKDSLVFATFYGGSGDEFGNSVDVTSTGLIFIGGQTFSSGSGGIQIQSIAGASNQILNGMSIAPSGASPADGFIAEFAPNGNSLLWSRYYGGSQDDGINSIYIDNADNLHFTGFARSNNITMVNAAQASLSPSSSVTNIDAIVGKFNSSNALVYSTYLGGGYSSFSVTKDEGRDITVDGSGNAIVVGSSDAFDFPCNNATGNTNTFYDASFGGAKDGFMARFSPTGTKQFASYFGGAGTFGYDEITRVNYNAVKNEIYFAGQSNDTTSFPYVVLPGAFNLKRQAPFAAFIASMQGDLTKQWSTNYGKAASNFSVTGIASDYAGIIYLTGQAKTNTLSYPLSAPTLVVYKDTIRNADDGFVTIFNPQKNLFHAHYLGGTGNDYINNAYVGSNTKLYVVGNTGSTDYPIAYNSINIPFIDSTFGGGLGQNDGFITRFDMSTIQIISVKETAEVDYLLNVYPNPSTSGFTIEMKDEELKNAQLKVYNITGQLMVEQKITQALTKFYCESWANGVYIINVNTNSKLKTFKLIKN